MRTQNETEALARQIMELARDILLVKLRFMDVAIHHLALVPYHGSLATDGSTLFFDAKHVIRSFKAERTVVTRDYLHVVLHCVFRHMFIGEPIDHGLWDLACDIAVEGILEELGLDSVFSARQQKQAEVLQKLRREVAPFTAEKLYQHMLNIRPGSAKKWAALFRADDHSLWYARQEAEALLPQMGSRAERFWRAVSQQIEIDLETFSREHGSHAGGMVQNLREVNRERVDYSAFLQKFAVKGEVMGINPDEFDYIFYTYGLEQYHNMPLIEPLEYKEVKRIREFAIAIDTSGSVSGELVQAFIQKTYNILKATESFFSKINLHIIQCDATIQEDVKITSQEEFDQYLKTMTLKGFGGTDFRPVFAYVEQLRKNRELQNLKGLLYFTDGYGTFPRKKPDYETAFVFVQDGYETPEVPPWAIKLVLREREIKQFL